MAVSRNPAYHREVNSLHTAVLLAALVVSQAARAAEPEPTPAPAEPAAAATPVATAVPCEPTPKPAAKRAAKIGITFQDQIWNPWSGTSSDGAIGFHGVYEYLLSPRMALGIVLVYRLHFGTAPVNQLVYGLNIKHYLVTPDEGAPAPAFRPYVQYGLLQQISRQSGVKGAAVSYDAGLMAGGDFALGPVPMFLEAAFHVSHLAFLGVDTQNLSYAEATTGVRYVF